MTTDERIAKIRHAQESARLGAEDSRAWRTYADDVEFLLAELDAARAREVELTDAIDSLLSLITGETGENCDVQRAIEALSETRAQFEARILKRDAKIREALTKLAREALVVVGFAQAWTPLSAGDIADLRRAGEQARAALAEGEPLR